MRKDITEEEVWQEMSELPSPMIWQKSPDRKEPTKAGDAAGSKKLMNEASMESNDSVDQPVFVKKMSAHTDDLEEVDDEVQEIRMRSLSLWKRLKET